MGLVIRSASLTSDREQLIVMLSRCLNPAYNAARFDWLYRDNPHGQAVVWVAQEPGSREIVGTAAAFPRRLYVGEEERLGWVLGDFCLAERYRSVGPALQLQRTCLSAVDAGAAALCYDLPSVAMMAIYRRLGMSPAGQMLRLAKPLRVDRKVKAVVSSPTLLRGLSVVGNTALKLRDWRPQAGRSVTIALHDDVCGEEFSALARHVGGRYGVCVQRSAAYLNWRYGANPLSRCELLTARRGDALLGYVVFSHHEDDATLLDLFGSQDNSAIQDLLTNVVALLRIRGVVTITAPIADSHRWAALLQRHGFVVRETSPLIVYIPLRSEPRRGALARQNWSFMHGDRDG
jgi:hypothetical protein